MERKIARVQFPAKMPTLKNVAAYARVSSGKDAMLHSLSAQVSYGGHRSGFHHYGQGESTDLPVGKR